jgi:two-component system sensor histidine kinase AtoS
MSNVLDHSVFRYSRHVLCLLFAGATVVICGMINPHSIAWALAVYLTVLVFVGALRRISEGAIYRAFAVYLFCQILYLLAVLLLHVVVPAHSPEQALKVIYFWLPIFSVGGFINATAHYHFVLYFTQSRSRFLKFICYLFWAASAFFLTAEVTGHFRKTVFWSGHTWVPDMSPMYTYFFYLISSSLTMGLVVPIIAVFTSKTRERRIQMFFYSLGALPAWMAFWSNFLISMGFKLYPSGGIFFLIHAALIAYAVLQYRAFPITLKIRRGLAYAMCCIVLGTLYAGISLAFWQAGPQSSLSLIARLSLLLAFIFIYAPLLGWLQQRLDSFFFRDSVDREQLLERFVQETSAVLDLNRIAKSLCGALDSGLKPRRVDFYLKPSNQAEFALYGSYEKEFTPGPWPSNELLRGEVAERMAREHAAFSTQFAPTDRVDRGVQIATGDEALAVPVVHGTERLGCIVIGPKTADEPFTVEDIRFAETLASSSSSVLQNARSFSQIERLQKLTASILNSLSTGVLLVSEEGDILTANNAARTICATGERFPTKVSMLWEIQPILASAIRRALKENDLRSNDELTLEGERGTCVLLSINDLSVDEPHNQFVVMMHDITDYKKMQALAEQREHLARIGEAAATINHEIKNLLQPVRHQMNRLTHVDVNNPAAIKKELNRATAVVPGRLTALEKMLRNLNHLGRPLNLRMVSIELESMARAVWSEIGATSIAFQFNIAEGAENFVADGGWMRQVLYNLMLNAADATSGVPQGEVRVSAALNEGRYTLAIHDNGCGITVTDQRKLFEPFFSTKGQAGTGLGLCLSRKIVESHGGRISVESEPGKTTFSIVLPQRPVAVENAAAL